MNGGTILGIDPGTRFTGIAVLRNRKLVEYQVKTYLGAWSPKKLQAIIIMLAAVIERYGIRDVAVTVPDSLPDSLGFTQLIGSINALCDRKGIRPYYSTLSDLKAKYCGGKGNNKDLMAAIALKYPELVLEYRKEEKNKEGYYHKVFEAVAAAALLSEFA